MAIQVAARFKPDTYHNGLQTLIQGFSPSPLAGLLILAVQLCAYDDAQITGANYVPGDPAVERYITVLYEDTLSGDLAVLGAGTQAAANTFWANALSAWATSMAPAKAALLNSRRGPLRSNPVTLP